MYIASKSLGIGTVQSVEDGRATVYFPEVDKTNPIILKYASVFATEQEADDFLNKPMSADEAEEIRKEMEEMKRSIEEGIKASNWLQDHNAEAARKMWMKR